MVVRKLSGKNPRYPQPLYQWHYYHGEYREMVKPCDDHENIMRQSSGIIHIDSQEAQWQIEDEQAPDQSKFIYTFTILTFEYTTANFLTAPQLSSYRSKYSLIEQLVLFVEHPSL